MAPTNTASRFRRITPPRDVTGRPYQRSNGLLPNLSRSASGNLLNAPPSQSGSFDTLIFGYAYLKLLSSNIDRVNAGRSLGWR